MEYVTKQNDVLDDVIFRHYGTTKGIVEKVLERNRPLGLADYDTHLPAGLVIDLPEIENEEEEKTNLTRLWD